MLLIKFLDIISSRKFQLTLLTAFIITLIYIIFIFVSHYEYDKDIPIIFVIFGYIFLSFWGIIIVCFILFILFFCIIFTLQCICMECCDSPPLSPQLNQNIG
jgi:hypothetical protein